MVNEAAPALVGWFGSLWLVFGLLFIVGTFSAACAWVILQYTEAQSVQTLGRRAHGLFVNIREGHMGTVYRNGKLLEFGSGTHLLFPPGAYTDLDVIDVSENALPGFKEPLTLTTRDHAKVTFRFTPYAIVTSPTKRHLYTPGSAGISQIYREKLDRTFREHDLAEFAVDTMGFVTRLVEGATARANQELEEIGHRIVRYPIGEIILPEEEMARIVELRNVRLRGVQEQKAYHDRTIAQILEDAAVAMHEGKKNHANRAAEILLINSMGRIQVELKQLDVERVRNGIATDRLAEETRIELEADLKRHEELARIIGQPGEGGKLLAETIVSQKTIEALRDFVRLHRRRRDN